MFWPRGRPSRPFISLPFEYLLPLQIATFFSQSERIALLAHVERNNSLIHTNCAAHGGPSGISLSSLTPPEKIYMKIQKVWI